MIHTLLITLALAGPLAAAAVRPPRAAPAVATASAGAEAALRAGQAALESGDEAGAETLWRSSLSNAEDSGLLYALGGLLFKQLRLAEAEAVYKRLARRSPELADAWYQLGLLRAAQGRYRDAADAQRLAVSRAQGFGQAYCALALDLRESGQAQEGLEAAAEALRLLPAYAGAWNLQGNLQLDLGMKAEAEASYRRAVELEPRYAGAWINLGLLLEKSGRIEEARAAFDHAVRADEGRSESRFVRAELALVEGALDAAERDYAALAVSRDFEPEGHWGLHRVAKARQDAREAARRLKAYRIAVRKRDRAADEDRSRGVERPHPYEPGLPLAFSPGASVTPTPAPGEGL